MSISESADRGNVLRTCNGIFFSLKKEGNAAICDNINEPGRHYVKWEKPVTGQRAPEKLGGTPTAYSSRLLELDPKGYNLQKAIRPHLQNQKT